MPATTIQAPTEPGLDAFSAALEEFTRAQRRVAGRFNHAPAVPELSKAQYLLLEPLLHAGEVLSAGQLAEAAGVSAPSATRMLDALVTRGIVARTRHDSDRRIVLIALTAHGEDLVERKRRRVMQARAAVYAQLTPTERRGAARLLRRLAVAIEELQP